MAPATRGIQPTRWGFRAYVRVKGFPLQTKRFKRHHTLDKIQEWRELTRAKLIVRRELRQRAQPEAPDPTTFRGAARQYLNTVTALATYKERVRHIGEWVDEFGDQDPQAITSAQIRARRDRLLMVGPKLVQKKVGGKRAWVAVAQPLSAGSVNKRLRALENLYTVLWPGTPNPVRQVPEADEPESRPQAIPKAWIAKIFRAMPPSKTRARLKVIRWTGIPHKTIGRLTRADVDLRRKQVTLPGRKKGRGTRGGVLPLLPGAVAAFREFVQADAWGPFSPSAMYKSVQLACAKVRAPAITPYQFRHTFATEFLAATKDLRATQKALDHSTPRLTEAYARAAVDPALAYAYRQVAATHRAKRRGRVAGKVTTRRKRP